MNTKKRLFVAALILIFSLTFTAYLNQPAKAQDSGGQVKDMDSISGTSSEVMVCGGDCGDCPSPCPSKNPACGGDCGDCPSPCPSKNPACGGDCGDCPSPCPSKNPVCDGDCGDCPSPCPSKAP